MVATNDDGQEKQTAKRRKATTRTKATEEKDAEPKIPKKRGRKPKGGKIIATIQPEENLVVAEPNIILHLKCGSMDLKDSGFLKDRHLSYDPSDVGNIDSYNFEGKGDVLSFGLLGNSVSDSNKCCNKSKTDDESVESDDRDIISDKLKQLAVNLHTNNISDKRSACFGCTCDFDNPPIYIPKYELDGSYHVYGCFCSPECACAHLFKQSDLKSSTRFERYHLLNHIYCKIYDYKRNIKPAPDPYYTLDKFYGNLTIQQYRSLLKNERVLLVVDKPLVRSLPELHEDNDEFMISNKSLSTSSSKFKLRRSTKRQTKSEILNANFGLG